MTRSAALPLVSVGIESVEVIFSAFADPTRLRILNLLSCGELCVCDIVDILELPQPTVSRHLALLRSAALVGVTRDWKYAHYRLAEPSSHVHGNLISCVRTCFTGIKQLDAERRRAIARIKQREIEPCE